MHVAPPSPGAPTPVNRGPLRVRAGRAAGAARAGRATRAGRGTRAAYAVVAAAALVSVLTGCTAIGDAQQVIDRARLVNDLASRLDHAGELTYTAEYQLSGGGRATIAQAQDPLRVAYTYPQGKLMLLPDRTVDCRAATAGAAPTCTLSAPPSATTDPASGLLAAVGDRGLVPPTVVVRLLTAASLSSDAVVAQHDTTIAGEHATCVDVAGVENAPSSKFTACITAAGVLGQFSGTFDGAAVDASLTRYADSVAEDAFDLPSAAKVVDTRSPH